MSAIGGLFKRIVATVAPQRVIIRGSVAAVRQIALTFDDGPHPENTPKILDALDANGALGTFFMQGSCARLYPKLVREVHRRGHMVANHAFSHQTPKQLGTSAYVNEVLDTQALLCDTVGAPLSRHFRPPYGDITVPTLYRLLNEEFRLVYWSRDSRDSWLTNAPALLNHFSTAPPDVGDIVLFHDDYAQTAAALPGLLKTFRDLDLQTITIEQML